MVACVAAVCVAGAFVVEDSDVSVASAASAVAAVVVVVVVIAATTITTVGTITNSQKKKWISIEIKCPCIICRKGTSLLIIILDKNRTLTDSAQSKRLGIRSFTNLPR